MLSVQAVINFISDVLAGPIISAKVHLQEVGRLFLLQLFKTRRACTYSLGMKETRPIDDGCVGSG